MLEFPNSWRFSTPGELPQDAYQEFSQLTLRIARGRQNIIEHFKKFFASTSGSTCSWSSSASWAESDLHGYMRDASKNAPLFIEAFFDACQELKSVDADTPVPDFHVLNKILINSESKYRVDPPKLLTISDGDQVTLPKDIPMSLDQKAKSIILASFDEANKFLDEGRFKPAVQELLWLLETVSTVYKGVQDTESTIIQGKYFNKIIGELSRNSPGTALNNVLKWIETMHGYLSAPAGGGIRHGRDLKAGISMSSNEATLYCNLITSYIKFLLAEYDRLVVEKAED
mgnify:CR=1 FL=1